MSREDVERRHADAEIDVLFYLAAVEHGDTRLAADVLFSIGLTAPAAFIAFNKLARELLKAQQSNHAMRELILSEHIIGTLHADCCGRRECAVCYSPWPCTAARVAGVQADTDTEETE